MAKESAQVGSSSGQVNFGWVASRPHRDQPSQFFSSGSQRILDQERGLEAARLLRSLSNLIALIMSIDVLSDKRNILSSPRDEFNKNDSQLLIMNK
ncbi:7009_t:CDS:2, partial [Acaulospora colombiana]